MKWTKAITRVDQVAAWRLCMGCGACAHACQSEAIQLVDILDQGIRPAVDRMKCKECGECVQVCPGVRISHQPFNGRTLPELCESWGPVLEVWEGFAADPEIRFKGSSGGVATALALFCLEKEQISGVLHIGANSEAPLQNVPTLSKNRQELLAHVGSRYSPAAPCGKLGWVRESRYRSVFIGKPCDVVALRKSQAADSKLDEKIGLAISIFCAGTPPTAGTYKILDELGVRAGDVEEFRYRGCGWPGMTTVRVKNSDRTRQMAYDQSWGDILCNYSQFRCRLCPDSTGEFADISCGDPWYREIQPGEKGRSLVVVRTERGRRTVQEARNAGYLRLQNADPSILPRSQKALLVRRRHLWGRLLTMRMMRVPVPYYTGFSLLRNWFGLSAIEKVRSLAGTMKRIISRGWMKPLKPIVNCQEPHDFNGADGPLMNPEEFKSRCKV